MAMCFANDKYNEEFVTLSEAKSKKMTCYALSFPAFEEMKARGKCGTMGCPFFKPNRSDIRLSDKIIHVEK